MIATAGGRDGELTRLLCQNRYLAVAAGVRGPVVLIVDIPARSVQVAQAFRVDYAPLAPPALHDDAGLRSSGTGHDVLLRRE
jgi:hypothetical protein